MGRSEVAATLQSRLARLEQATAANHPTTSWPRDALINAGLSELEAIERFGSLGAFAYAAMTAPTPANHPADGLSAQERYLRMLDPNGGRHAAA